MIALITYGILHVDDAIDDRVQRFYRETIAPYWPAERRHVEDGYRSLPFPFEKTSLQPLAMEAWWTLDELAGYFNTWSAVRAAELALGSNPVERLREEWQKEPGKSVSRYRVTWPLSVRAGHIQR